MGKPTKKRKISDRRNKISELFRSGITSQNEIAKMVGCTQCTVSRDLKVIQQKWEEETIDNIDFIKKREIEKLSCLENTYWKSFEKSLKRTILSKEGVQIEVQAPGDPRFLSGVLNCIDKRMKLLGLEAPKKLNIKDETDSEDVLVLRVSKKELNDRVKMIEDDLKRRGLITKPGECLVG